MLRFLLMILIIALPLHAADDANDLAGKLLGDLKDLDAWGQKNFRYRQRLLLVRGPKTDIPELAVIEDFSIKRLAAAEKLGTKLIAVADEGDELPIYYMPAEDACVVKLTPTMVARESVTIAIYYGDNGTFKMAAPTAKIGEAHKTWRAFPAAEEARDAEPADGPSPSARKFIERYARLVLVEPAGNAKPERVAGANADSIAMFSANNGAVKTGAFSIAADGAHSVRVRIHAATAVDTTLKINLSGPGGETSLRAPCKGQGFFWCEAAGELKKGEYTATINAPTETKAGVDFILFSPDAEWRPDYDALWGPIWVRYRIGKDSTPANSIEMSATYDTYTINGPQHKPDGEFFPNAWFFGPRIKSLFPPAALKPALTPGKWTPWGRLLEAGSWTWQETATFRGGKVKNVDVQFAFGPSEGEVFRHNRTTAVNNQITFRMPSSPNNFGEALFCARTLEDFLDWRLSELAKFNLEPGHQLKKLYFSAFPYGSENTEELESRRAGMFALMGFNGLDQGDNGFVELYKKHGLIHHHMHHWINDSNADWAKLPGETYSQKMASYRDEVLRTIHSGKWIGKVPEFGKFNILVDEPGPFVEEGSFQDKGMEQLFIAYLKEQKVEPAFFGLKGFDEFKWPKPGMSKAQAREARAAAVKQIVEENKTEISLVKEAVPEFFLDDKDAKDADEKKKKLEVLGNKNATDALAAENYNKGFKLFPDPATREGKRLRWYIRQFQSDFTGRVGNAIAEATYKESPTKVHSGPNFQATPVWSGFMWEGGLDLLRYGRLQTQASFIQIEDWAWSGAYLNCAFAGALIRAACRPGGAVPAALVTGGRTRPKIMGWLSQGVRKFDSYLYGPMHAIGPPWADDPITYHNMGTCIHEMQRAENHIVECKHVSEIAQLVANTSEIILKTKIDRRGMFKNLILAGHGVDLVSEDDVELDEILAKYKALVICDEGVRRATQTKIKSWVEGGGRVLIGNGACAFDEFEEPCDVLLSLKPKEGVNPAASVGKGTIVFLSDKDSAPKSVEAMDEFVKAAGVKPQWASDCPGLWATATFGEKKEVVFVIKGVAPKQTTVQMKVFRATKPKEVYSARLNKNIPFEFADGAVTFALEIPACFGLPNIQSDPNTDILVLLD